MPDTSCPRCGRSGFVRKERIIKANSASVGHYCGACQFEWAIADDEATDGTAISNPPDRGERSRQHPPDVR